MTIQELAEKYADMFITAKRDNGETYLSLNEENEDLTQLIRDAHGDMMPDDYKYEYIHNSLEAIAECELHDNIHEISMESDCYNSDLLKWLSSSLSRADYIDEVVNNFGYESFYNTLMLAQQREREDVLRSVIESLIILCEGQDNDN